MEHMFTRIYALLVCFVSMVCIAITTGVLLYDIVKVVNPELTLSPYQYQHLQSNQIYRRGYGASRLALSTGEVFMNPRGRGTAQAEEIKELSEEDITRLREQEFQVLLDNERKVATASIVRLIIILIVSCPLFYVHWRLAQRYEAPA